MNISSITVQTIREWAENLEKKGLSVKYMNKIKELIDKNRLGKEKIDEVDNLNKDLGYVESKPREYVEVLENDFPSVYLISSDEFEESEFYPKRELVYYTNGVIVDEDYNVIDDIDSIISKDVYASFDDHLKNAEDIVWVRNDDISTDFEVQLADYDFTG